LLKEPFLGVPGFLEASHFRERSSHDTSLNWWPHHDGLNWLADDDKLEAKRVMT
jgi:hypothetical protein